MTWQTPAEPLQRATLALSERLAAVAQLDTSAEDMRREVRRAHEQLVSDVAGSLVSDVDVAELAASGDQGFVVQVLDEIRFRITKAMSELQAEASPGHCVEINVVDDAVATLAARTRTPPHYAP